MTFLQLLAELERITGATIGQLKGIWYEAVPKIFTMAKQGHAIPLMNSETDGLSDGKSAR